MPRQVLIKIRRGTEAQLPVLDVGELGFCTDTNKLYIGTPNGNQLLVAAQSVGDMLKSIYDTDYDGKVDAAETADSVPWSGVTGKPSTFTPSSHKSMHAQGGSDPLSPSDIGAVNKTGDSMTGSLIISAGNDIKLRGPTSGNGSDTGDIIFEDSTGVELMRVWRDSTKGAVIRFGSADSMKKIWHEGNDGAGSGLDADMLDGKHATDFMPKGPITWNQLKGV